MPERKVISTAGFDLTLDQSIQVGGKEFTDAVYKMIKELPEKPIAPKVSAVRVEVSIELYVTLPEDHVGPSPRFA